MTFLWRAVVVLAASVVCLPARASLLATANVMAPLDLDAAPVGAWDAFKLQLKVAKSMGVDAVSVDVWWGKVERSADNNFDWSYYDKIAAAVEAAGLHWVPIMSFHECGGNVHSDSKLDFGPLQQPRRFEGGIAISQRARQREQRGGGAVAGQVVIPQYQEFMSAFQAHFASKAGIIDEVSLSTGPAGELRYPSYDVHDGASCGFPTRGCFQAYSGAARADFQAYVSAKYHDIAGANAAWKDSLGSSGLASLSQIGPPDNQDPGRGRAEDFISRDDDFRTQYWRDFIDWYNQCLVDHGQRMLDAAIAIFGSGPFKTASLGIKMAGVHWQMMDNAVHPRVAEIASGLIQTSLGNLKQEANPFGYKKILDMVATYRGRARIDFHFTCLEKDDMEWDGSSHAFSLAKTLVFWVAQGATDRGLLIKGENALRGGVMSDQGWDNIWNAFHWAGYTGLTVLRVSNVTTDSDVGQRRYRDFIAVCKVSCSPPPQ